MIYSLPKKKFPNLSVEQLEKFLKKYFIQLLIIVLAFSALLRLFNFYNHIALQSDTTRDIAIAKEAIERREIPVTGSFSSAGPFVFGPTFYWFLMISYLIWPFSLLTPWVIVQLIGLLTVATFMYFGKIVGGYIYAFILLILFHN